MGTQSTVLVTSQRVVDAAIATADLAALAVTPPKISVAGKTYTVIIPVEDLAADADIADRVSWVAPVGLTFTKISAISQGSPAGIDNSNTCVIVCKKNLGGTPIVTKTYDTSNVFPADNTQSDLGTLESSEKVFTAGQRFSFSVTNGTNSNPPAFNIQLEYTPT